MVAYAVRRCQGIRNCKWTLIDRTGKTRAFSVLMTKAGIVIHHRSHVSPNQPEIRFCCSDCRHELLTLTSSDNIGKATVPFPTPLALILRLKRCPNCRRKLGYDVNPDDVTIRKIKSPVSEFIPQIQRVLKNLPKPAEEESSS
jgi:DNA replicative helicase MCM subunit Mcm2 (Cdc46/Mcm family)